MKNVVLLTIDALRKDMLGLYGDTHGLSPFIDTLRDKSTIFTNAQTVGPYTQASFPGILTSSYYFEHGKEEKLSPKRMLVSEVLKRSGIYTAAFHSAPYLSGYFGWNRGWDTFYDSMDTKISERVPYVRGNDMNEKIGRWLNSHVRNEQYRPFFLWVHYMDVHEPYIPKRKFLDMVDPSLTLNEDQMFDLFKTALLPRNATDPQKVETLRKLYMAQVPEVDEYVREFFGMLSKVGVLKDTVVIISADHGDEFGEHGSLSHDGKMFSELLNVPLVVYDGAKAHGETCDIVVSNVDISPTIVSLFNLPPVEAFKGHSFLPVENYPDMGVYGEAVDKFGRKVKETDKPVYYFRDKNLKIVYKANGDVWEMYDLAQDPKELNNIIGQNDKTEYMKEKLNSFVTRRRI